MLGLIANAFKSMAARPYLTLILAGVLASIVYMATSFVNDIIDGYIEQGRLEERVKWQTAESEATTTAADNLAAQQAASRTELEREREIARIAARVVAAKQNKLLDELEALRNVKDTECIRISNDSVRLLNSGARAYNCERGLSEGCGG